MKNSISNWIAAVAFGAACGGSALACTSSPQVTYNSASALMAGSSLPESTFAALAPSVVTAADDLVGNRSVVGLWDVKFYDSTGKIVVDHAYEIFHEDGTELMTDTSAPATDNVCVGVYRQTGIGNFKLKHVSFVFDLAGNLLGTATFHTTLTVDARGNAFQGTSTVDVFDNNGNVVFHAAGPVRATRITAD